MELQEHVARPDAARRTSAGARPAAHDPTRYVQWGCGMTAPETWTNFDASPTLRLQRLPIAGRVLRGPGIPAWPRNVRYGDIVRGLPVAAGSCRGVYSSHVLEHLSLEEARLALRHTYAILAPGGVFRCVLPDLEAYVRAYVASDGPDAGHSLLRSFGIGEEHRPRGATRVLTQAVRHWVGNGDHRWMWDYKALASELKAAGFREVRRAEFGDAADPRFADVERADRWAGALGVEAVK